MSTVNYDQAGPEHVTVADANRSFKEIDGLLLEVGQEEAEELLNLAIEDPLYSEAIDTQAMLSRFAHDLGSLVAAKEMGPSKIADADLEENDGQSNCYSQSEIAKLLAEIEDDGQLEIISEQHTADIEKSHDLLRQYNGLRNHMPARLSRKQLSSLESSLRKQIESRWEVSDIVDDPGRLKTIFESIMCMDDISEDSRAQVLKSLVDNTYRYAERKINITPEDIGKRLIVCSHDGIADKELTKVLLDSFFSRVRGAPCEAVIDNFELFVRGILRTINYPKASLLGVSIAEFKTSLIQNGSKYAMNLRDVPTARLDDPTLMQRAMSTQKALAQIKMYFEDPTLDVFGNSQATRNRWTELKSAQEAFFHVSSGRKVSDLSENEIYVGRVIQAAVQRIGIDTYLRRMDVMEFVMTLTQSNDQMLKDFLRENLANLAVDENAEFNDFRFVEILISAVTEKYPLDADFIRGLLESTSIVQDELPQFLKDPVGDLRKIFEFGLGSGNERKLMQGYFDEVRDIFGDDDSPSGSEALRELVNFTETVAVPTNDGFMIEFLITKGDQQITEEETKALIAELDPQAIQRAKEKVSTFGGLHRRFHRLENTGRLMATIRPQNEQDHKQVHPLESQLSAMGVMEGLTSQSFNTAIEEAHFQVLHNRRRFMNERGIAIELIEDDDPDDDPLRLEIMKHPLNPQAFIGTLNFRDSWTRFLINPDLHIELGDKKVYSLLNLLALNSLAAEAISVFMCQEVVETEEGTIGDGKNSITDRIAHLRLLPEGQKYSYDAWSHCLEAEGLDLEVLSDLQAMKKDTQRKSTYVKAIEKDDPTKGPLTIYINFK